MEAFFYITCILLLTASVSLNFVLYARVIQYQLDSLEMHARLSTAINENYAEIISAVGELSNNINRSTLAQKDILEPTKPIKPNNWDSVREAFKGPARIEVNERN